MNKELPRTFFACCQGKTLIERSTILHLIARILNIGTPNKIFLDAPHVYKPAQQILASGFVVGATSSGSTERLLPDHGASALTVDVEVSR